MIMITINIVTLMILMILIVIEILMIMIILRDNNGLIERRVIRAWGRGRDIHIER